MIEFKVAVIGVRLVALLLMVQGLLGVVFVAEAYFPTGWGGDEEMIGDFEDTAVVGGYSSLVVPILFGVLFYCFSKPLGRLLCRGVSGVGLDAE